MKTILALFVIAAIFSVIRFFIPSHPLSPSGSYQALAHLFVGGLIGAWMASKEKWYGFLALGLTAVELVAFFSLK